MANNTKSGPPIKCLPGEQWLPVAGHEAYSISSMGRLWSHIHHRLLRPVRGHVVLAGGRPVNVGELVLETHGGQPRRAAGMISWPVDRDVRWPYRTENLAWISRPEMLKVLSRERAARLASERARCPRPRPQATVIEYPAEPGPAIAPKKAAPPSRPGAHTGRFSPRCGWPAGGHPGRRRRAPAWLLVYHPPECCASVCP
jgi:hypothetical protein